MKEPTADNCRRWCRYSLRSILTFSVIATLGVLHLFKSRELEATKTALAELRRELGEISIGDPTKTHVYSRPTDVADEWCWRLYVPPGAKYKLLVEVDMVDPSSGGQTLRTVTDTQHSPSDCLDAGLYTIRFHFRHVYDESNNACRCPVRIDFMSEESYGRLYGGFGTEYVEKYHPWASDGWSRQVRVSEANPTISVSPTEEIVLFALHSAPPGSQATESPNTKPSLLVHLVPVTTP